MWGCLLSCIAHVCLNTAWGFLTWNHVMGILSDKYQIYLFLLNMLRGSFFCFVLILKIRIKLNNRNKPTNQPSTVLGALGNETAGEGVEWNKLKRRWGGEATKGVVEKAGHGLWWRWGGERAKVIPPSDISWATEAVTTRSAEVQVSERDDWLTRPSGTSPALRPGWTFHPSFPPSPRHSSVTHSSLPSTATFFALFTLCLPTEPRPCHPLSLPSFLSPHSPSFSPLKLNITTGFHSAGQADWGSWGCVSSVHHHVVTLTEIYTHTCCTYMHTGCWHVHIEWCQSYRNIWTIWVWKEFPILPSWALFFIVVAIMWMPEDKDIYVRQKKYDPENERAFLIQWPALTCTML